MFALTEYLVWLSQIFFLLSLSLGIPWAPFQGCGSRLVDESGVSYLDTRNNVAHCGHCHERIVRAVQHQVSVLNTNTRYLHPTVVALAERLVAKLPAPLLNVVFFCNSGSEANDLALRLARAWSGGSTNTIVVDGAYHGHTIATLEVSPYKYETSREYQLPRPKATIATTDSTLQSPGRHIWKVPCPDTYRGLHRDPETAGKLYAQYVHEACQFYTDSGESVRAFIVEGGMSVAGVILPPPGYLSSCAEAVRRAGGVYIADEVQTGFGRFGTSFWAFEYNNDTIPDIVTVGKPFGNGMPLAAVVTSRKIASAFEACNVEYFNTFGGNPVCAAAGLAVLDVVEEEQLQQHAHAVGTYLKSKLNRLLDHVEIIGDVRGCGLFLGIELVRDRSTLEPADTETSWLCSHLKGKYKILTSIDGPNSNVLVVKPPMVFNGNDADYFVESLKSSLVEDLPAAGDIVSMEKTPT
jgi:ethanolamine-phosphate phospho-lyase